MPLKIDLAAMMTAAAQETCETAVLSKELALKLSSPEALFRQIRLTTDELAENYAQQFKVNLMACVTAEAMRQLEENDLCIRYDQASESTDNH